MYVSVCVCVRERPCVGGGRERRESHREREPQRERARGREREKEGRESHRERETISRNQPDEVNGTTHTKYRSTRQLRRLIQPSCAGSIDGVLCLISISTDDS